MQLSVACPLVLVDNDHVNVADILEGLSHFAKDKTFYLDLELARQGLLTYAPIPKVLLRPAHGGFLVSYHYVNAGLHIAIGFQTELAIPRMTC